MASEASRKKARETCDHDHNTVGCWTCGTLQPCKPCEAIAAALDEARGEGEKEASAAYKKGYIRGLNEGAERERWECYEAVARALSNGNARDYEMRACEAISCRGHMLAPADPGPMRGPEEEEE